MLLHNSQMNITLVIANCNLDHRKIKDLKNDDLISLRHDPENMTISTLRRTKNKRAKQMQQTSKIGVQGLINTQTWTTWNFCQLAIDK